MLLRRSLPPLRLLTVFETVLRSGGVQNAASELNVTQPAVSQALRSLEDHIGARLLDRRMRPATPTPAGEILIGAVTSGMDQIEQAIDRIRSVEEQGKKTVTVACTVCTGTYWLMPRLAAFYGLYPDISVRVVTSSGVPRLAPGTDLVIRYGDGTWSDGESEVLFAERAVPVCSPDAFVRLGGGDLDRATLLQVEAGADEWPGWDDYFRSLSSAGAKAGQRAAARRIFGNHVEATQAAVAGMGVLLGWISNTADLVREGRLVVFFNKPFVPGGAFHVVRPANGDEKAAAGQLASYLRETVRG